MVEGEQDGWFTRERLKVLVLLAATVGALHLCYKIVLPFLPALTWALAFAIMFHPVHQGIARRVKWPGVASFLAVVVVACVLLGPVGYVGRQLAKQATSVGEQVKAEADSGQLRQRVTSNPKLAPMLQWVEGRVDLEEQARQLGQRAFQRVDDVLRGTVDVLVQLVISLFVLFFLFRDRREALRGLRTVLPMSNEESTQVTKQVNSVIHATLYGVLVVSAIQGTLGGLMFWILGLPAPVLWGAVMAVLAVIPMLGTFLIWAPAAVYLIASGSAVKGIILFAYGLLAISSIDNLLYPFLVGKDMKLHTLLVFFSLLGGVSLFGVSGLILGPVVLAITLALLDLWRRRTTAGHTADTPQEPAPPPAREPELLPRA